MRLSIRLYHANGDEPLRSFDFDLKTFNISDHFTQGHTTLLTSLYAVGVTDAEVSVQIKQPIFGGGVRTK